MFFDVAAWGGAQVMPRSQALFAAAGMESGAAATWASLELAIAETNFNTLTALVNCSSCSNVISCLLNTSADALVTAAHTVPKPFRRLPWSPVVDGVELIESTYNLTRKGTFRIATIIGTCRGCSSCPNRSVSGDMGVGHCLPGVEK